MIELGSNRIGVSRIGKIKHEASGVDNAANSLYKCDMDISIFQRSS
jgi:hypothetical protein